MHKVRWDCKAPHEMLNNYKIIQGVFGKHGIDKVLDPTKLTRARFQDSLEAMQFAKSFFEANAGDMASYDAWKRR